MCSKFLFWKNFSNHFTLLDSTFIKVSPTKRPFLLWIQANLTDSPLLIDVPYNQLRGNRAIRMPRNMQSKKKLKWSYTTNLNPSNLYLQHVVFYLNYFNSQLKESLSQGGRVLKLAHPRRSRDNFFHARIRLFNIQSLAPTNFLQWGVNLS